MKKVFILILALGMVFSLTGIAFAGTVSGDLTSNNTDSANVQITVVAEDNGGSIYHVVLKWDDLAFTYSNAEKSWNPKTHTYDTDKAAKWDKETANFYIENHSNAKIQYNTTFSANANLPNTVTVDATHEGTLDSADDAAYRGDEAAASTIAGSEYKAGPNVKLEVKVSGTPSEAFSSATVGSVIVTISPVSP